MSRDENIRGLAKKWLEKADKDLLSAERELSFDVPITETVCFHCQQAVEKYLKAFLVHHQIYFPQTHKIIELLELCGSKDPSFQNELKEADNLTDYAVEVRYPDIEEEPSLEEAKDAIQTAKQVCEFVKRKL